MHVHLAVLCAVGTRLAPTEAKRRPNTPQFCRSGRNGFSAPAYQVDELRPERGAQQHVQVLRAFAGKILRGTPLVAEGEEGIRELMISNAMYLSSWLGRMVEIPFDEELFAIELEKRARL